MWHLTSTLQRPNKGEKERRARMMAAAARAAAANGADSSSPTTSASASGASGGGGGGGGVVGRAKTFRHNRNRSAGPITAPGDDHWITHLSTSTDH